nr:MAG: hypothetical protein [Penaeus monodon endogenous nimavirus]
MRETSNTGESEVTSSIGSNNAKYTVTTNKRLPRVSFKEQDPEIGSSFHRNIKVRNTINDKEQNNKGQETDDDSDDENNDDDDVIEKYSSTTNEVIVIYAKYKHK